MRTPALLAPPPPPPPIPPPSRPPLTLQTLADASVVTLCHEAGDDGSTDSGWDAEDKNGDWRSFVPSPEVLAAARGISRGSVASDVIWDRDTVGTDGAGFLWRKTGRYALARYGLTPPTPTEAVQWEARMGDELRALEARVDHEEEEEENHAVRIYFIYCIRIN